ncbi:N-acyl homoserine lactonase family protein [Lacisediminihabitans sp.]|uniref:N-acyl homoserine lactonase family protein n=1 Tax=Lacisediminihabitans sp. TaxID=2787631 RepID=UPI002F95C15D
MKSIGRVSVLSTGSVRIRPEHVESTGSPMLWWLLTSRRWTGARPINVYVIEHERGVVLFDTGQDRHSITDPGYFPRGIVGWLYARLARFSIGADETLTARLGALGHAAEDVHTVVLSHLHQDHIGGLPELRGAQIIVSGQEWAQLDSRFAEVNGLLERHIRLPGLRWEPVTPAPVDDPSIAPFTESHDVFGDGTLVLLPTPGHTPGSLSLLLRQEGMPPLLFVGDLTYDVECLAAERVPGVGRRAGLLKSTREVLALKERLPDLVILAAHDPAAAGLLQRALDRSGAR